MEARFELASADYRLTVAPSRGGSILAFTWRGRPLLRESMGPDILDAACFPLVPYSNRIAGGRFKWLGREVQLTPNYPSVDPVNPLHGTGWLADWSVLDAMGETLLLEHVYPGGEWPWAYRARLSYALGPSGLTARLELTNLSADPMPGGLGFHPYLPRDSSTRYCGLHAGEWQNDAQVLPSALQQRDHAVDWWAGAPVGTRPVDTVYTGREGPLEVYWPERELTVRLDCSDELALTSVFVPASMDWFCIEPVTHMTDALNRAGAQGGAMSSIAPGATCSAEMCLVATPA